jgi:hypothetical protein
MREFSIFDYLFLFSALLFNLLIAALFWAQKKGYSKLVKNLGIAWLCLAFPLAGVFIEYLIVGKDSSVLIYFGLVILYMLIEFLLDYILKFDFRKKLITHIPYIILEYAALFSLILIVINIDKTWGWIVGVSFWILLASLIYLYAGRKKTP